MDYFFYKTPPKQQTVSTPIAGPFLNKEECEKILASLSDKWDDGNVNVDPKALQERRDNIIRKVKLQPFDNKEIINRIIAWIHDVNQVTYKFDTIGIPDYDCITVMRYDADPEGGGHYDYHLDIGPKVMSNRKISFSIQLSHPANYDGGVLDFMPKFIIPREQGIIAIFPSFLCHRVTPVTRGSRYAIVGWIHGDHYR